METNINKSMRAMKNLLLRIGRENKKSNKKPAGTPQYSAKKYAYKPQRRSKKGLTAGAFGQPKYRRA